MGQLLNIVAIVLITGFVPVVVFKGLKVFRKNDYTKTAKITALVLFACEVLRFFVEASKYDLGRIPADDLKIGFVTFVSIFALFAAFMSGKLGAFLKKLFALLAFTVLIIGMCESRVYTLEADSYAIIKGLYFLESGLTFTLALLFVKSEKCHVDWLELLVAFGLWALYFGLSVFYIFYWNLSINLDAMYFIEKGAMLVGIVAAFFMIHKISNEKTIQ